MQGREYTHKEIIEILQRTPPFSSIDKSELAEIVEKAKVVHYKRHSTIFKEGENAITPFLLVLKGMVSVTKNARGGKVFTFDCRHKGDIIGWGSVIRGSDYATSFVALTDTHLLAINRDILLDLLSKNHNAQSMVIDACIEIIHKLYNTLIDIKTETADYRLSKVLITLNERDGCTIDLTHQDIAEMAWTTVETTTRFFQKLKKQGIISLYRGQIVINDPERLRLIGLI